MYENRRRKAGPFQKYILTFLNVFSYTHSVLTSVYLLIFGVVLVQSLDFVVFEAHKYGLRLILGLENNYDNFGGKAQYVQWARNAGQNLNYVDDFFTNPTVKGYYKNHVKVTNSINVYFYFIICLSLFHYVYKHA